MAGSQRSRRTRPKSSAQETETMLRQASSFALEAPHDAMLRSAVTCVSVAPLGSRAEARHSRVLRQRSMWVLSDVICAPFTNAANESGCTTKALRRTASASVCNLRLLLASGHHSSCSQPQPPSCSKRHLLHAGARRTAPPLTTPNSSPAHPT